MESKLIDIRNVSKIYRQSGAEVHALKNINLEVTRGEFVSIMGKSGSGKSTLLHLMAGLDQPTFGDICFSGELISKFSEKQLSLFRRKQIGFVYQFFNLIDSMTVMDNVILPCLLNGLSAEEARNRASELFRELGIQGIDHKFPGALSGGQRQRVAIARAIIHQPPILFADEPTGSLDSKNGEEVMRILSDLRQKNFTIVMVTHDMKLASQADRILFIQDGELQHETMMGNEIDPQSLLSKMLKVSL